MRQMTRFVGVCMTPSEYAHARDLARKARRSLSYVIRELLRMAVVLPATETQLEIHAKPDSESRSVQHG